MTAVYTPEAWAQAVREHQACLAEWDERLEIDPFRAFTMHGADLHLPRELPSPNPVTEENP